jgi:hypothetical protein
VKEGLRGGESVVAEIRKWIRVSNNWGARRIAIEQILRGCRIQ